MKRNHFDISEVKLAARSQWPLILARLGGCDMKSLNGDHHPCPKCGGNDRFRLIDQNDGAAICNQCARTGLGDGLSVLQWLTNKSFSDCLADVCDFLGVKPTSSPEKNNPVEHLKFRDWNEQLIWNWCDNKEPIQPASIQAIGGQLATYRDKYTVLAIPVWGPQLNQADPVGWIIYNLTGGLLPKYGGKDKDGNRQIEWVKIKLTHGSEKGIVGDVSKITSDAIKTIWKVEGPSDLLAMLSLDDLPADVTVVTNANGAGENLPAWFVNFFIGKFAAVLHDADQPGEAGAIGWTDHLGRNRPGCANLIAAKTECRHVKLPFPVVKDHGQDLRDYLNSGKKYQDLLQLLEVAGTVQAANEQTAQVIESDDDPHRLARVNLTQYGKYVPGGTLRYWRGEWFKYTGSHYKKIKPKELESKISAAIKQEFDRINLEAQKNATDDPPATKKVTTNLINNVIRATASLCVLSDSVEPNTWIDIDNNQRESRYYIALQNGILDLERVLEGEYDSTSDILLPHSPNWFSEVCLPYEFDENAECPKWLAVLEKNLEYDKQRLDICQEWAGYCLLPDTSFQKFMALEGEGANGKSVYLSVIAAMLGKQNCSFVALERFGERFDRTTTLGKLVNIAADAGEIDKVAEGYLKSFTSGDIMFFDRKGIDGINEKPTAKMMISYNNRPRFSDRSSGIWRRMLLIPWRVQIPPKQRIRGMDSIEFWIKSGELPGILNWAIVGLARLRSQGGFTESDVCSEALEDYRIESNPARSFLLENCEQAIGMSIDTNRLYYFYRKWSNNLGVMPLGSAQFGREVHRTFPESEKRRVGNRNSRYGIYYGIKFSQDEIFGEKTNEF